MALNRRTFNSLTLGAAAALVSPFAAPAHADTAPADTLPPGAAPGTFTPPDAVAPVEDAPTPIAAEVTVPEAMEDDGKETVVMDAIDPALTLRRS